MTTIDPEPLREFIPKMIGAFSTRELATFCWLAVLMILALRDAKLRRSFGGVVNSVWHWKILLPVALMATYVGIVVLTLQRLGLWSAALLKDTVWWFIFAGLALVFSANERATSKRGFWRRLFLDQTKALILIEWVQSTYTFPFAAELALFPVMVGLGAMSAIAQSDKAYAVVSKLVNLLVAMIGLTLLTLAVRSAVSTFTLEQSGNAVQSILLTPLLSISLLPFAYLLALVVTFESILVRIQVATCIRGKSLARYTVARIFCYCRLNLRKIHQFWRVYRPSLSVVVDKDDLDAFFRSAKQGHRGLSIRDSE